MNESELIAELTRRASVDRSSAQAVVDALMTLVREGAAGHPLLDSGTVHPSNSPSARLPISRAHDDRAVDELIARARQHRLGVEFLLDGYLGSVAAEFGAHAFTVEAARKRLREQLTTPAPRGNS